MWAYPRALCARFARPDDFKFASYGPAKLSMQFQVLNEIFFLGLGLTVTEINIKKVQKQDLKNIKNVKRCRDGMPKSMRTR